MGGGRVAHLVLLAPELCVFLCFLGVLLCLDRAFRSHLDAQLGELFFFLLFREWFDL